MRIIGIDPGTKRMGFACLDTEDNTILNAGHYDFSGKDVDIRLLDIERRLSDIFYYERRWFDTVAYEKMFSMGNAADAPLAVVAWMIRKYCKMTGVEFIEIPHTSVYKEITGDGKSTKEDVKAFLESLYDTHFVSLDASDAAAIAIAASTYRPKEKKPRTRKVQKASRDGAKKKP